MDPNSHTVELIKLFENLKCFPLEEICEQLDGRSLLLVSLLSEKWEQVVKARGIEEICIWEITLSKNVLMIYLNFDDDENTKKKMNFQIGFKEDPNSSEDFYFEYDKRWNSTTLHFKTSHQLEVFSFKTLELLSHLFPPSRYHRITVPLGPRCPDFPFRFLSKLPFGTTRYVDLQADQEVECADLLTFFRNVNIKDLYWGLWYRPRLNINVRMKNVVPFDEVFVQGMDVKIADARFMTGECLEKLDVHCAEIGENNFTSPDFNDFFRAWTRYGKECKLSNISFAIREDQKINIEEVLEGLNAPEGYLRIIDRWYLQWSEFEGHGYLYPKAIDFGQAHFIMKSDEILGAILLEPNRLSFFKFSNSSTWFTFECTIFCKIQGLRSNVQNAKDKQERLEKKIAARGVDATAKDLKKLVRCWDKIEIEERHLEEALEAQRKLYTEWNNNL